MRRTKVRKTEYVGLFVEPDLRATIEGEARWRKLNGTVGAAVQHRNEIG